MKRQKLSQIITEENWCQGVTFQGEKRACLIGHWCRQYNKADEYPITQKSIVLRKLAKTIEKMFPERKRADAFSIAGRIASFNDDPQTTVNDVIKVCKAAGL